MPRKNPNPQARRKRAYLKQRTAAKAAAKKPKRPMTVIGIPAALFAYLLGGRRDV